MRRSPNTGRVALGVLVGLLASACGEDTYIMVTVDGRAAVHDAVTLRVTLSNVGTMRTDSLAFDSGTFPVTFSVSAPGRSGELGIAIDAVNEDGVLVGHGAVTTTLDAVQANVMVETADFVVNTEVAEDQFPSDDFEAHGFQLSADNEGMWTTAYRDRCTMPCNMFARRFDASGRAVATRIAANENEFPMSTNLTTSLSTPAIATADQTTLQVWDFDDPAATTTGIACRALDKQGNATPDQLNIATDAGTDVVSVTPLSNANFAVTWNALITNDVIRSAIVRPDCTVLTGTLQTVSTTVTMFGARRGSVAASGSPSTILYAWIAGGEVYVRLANNVNTFPTLDQRFLPKSATEEIQHVRVAPLGTGFGVVVRWSQSAVSTGPGRIELYRTNITGAVLGQPLLVTSRSGSDFQSHEAFGVATRADGVMLVTWHSCLDNGDGSGCGVFARAIASDGSYVGEELVVATTTTGDQTNPSAAPLPGSFVIAWKDESGVQPDPSGSSVRARIVYPGAPGATQ